jgi:hypothetical protein
MKYESETLAPDAVRAHTSGGLRPRRLMSPRPWAKTNMPYWLQDTLAFLSVAGILTALFLITQFVGHLIRAASGTL